MNTKLFQILQKKTSSPDLLTGAAETEVFQQGGTQAVKPSDTQRKLEKAGKIIQELKTQKKELELRLYPSGSDKKLAKSAAKISQLESRIRELEQGTQSVLSEDIEKLAVAESVIEEQK